MPKMVWYGGEQVPASQTATGQCEDAPCCGCCGRAPDEERSPYEGEVFEDFDGFDGTRNYFWICAGCGTQNSVQDGDCDECGGTEARR